MKQKLTARDVLAAAQEERETILAHRRTIHRCPEVGQDALPLPLRSSQNVLGRKRLLHNSVPLSCIWNL